MKIEGDCPVCEGSLSIWDGFKAPTPYALMCPHCLAQVLVKLPSLRVVYTLVVIVYAGLGVGALYDLVMRQFGGYFGWLLAMAAFLAVAQVVMSLLSYNLADLEAAEPEI